MKKREIILEGTVKGIKARTVLWYLAFFGFAINTIVRINSSIAIVDMIDVNFRKSSNASKTVSMSECLAADAEDLLINNTIKSSSNGEQENSTRYESLERRFLKFFEVSQLERSQIGLVLASKLFNQNKSIVQTFRREPRPSWKHPC